VAKKYIAAEKAKQKAASNLAAERARIADDATAVSRIFSGRVRSYKKADLQALAHALLLSEDGTADILKERIEEHLTGPELEKTRLEINPRFFGLYPKPTLPRHHQSRISQRESSSGFINDPLANNETQQPSSTQGLGPSSHPLHPSHHTLSPVTPVPPLPAPQHPYGQPLPPYNPYQMLYSHPYHYPPAHV
jgi:hypothetical protein